MYEHSEGMIGIAPVPLGTVPKESFVARLVQEEKITNGIVSFYYSKYPDEIPSSVLIGDLDESKVEGGELGITYFDLLDDTDWTLEITQAFFGETVLFHHTFLPAVVYSGAPFVGLMDRDFKQLSSLVKDLDDSIYCDNTNCFGKEDCSYYSDITPDYSFTIGKVNTYTLSGETLFEHPGEEGGCQFALYNSGKQYILGEFFLQDYYTVYNVMANKIGLGKIVDLHPKLPEPVEGGKT